MLNNYHLKVHSVRGGSSARLKAMPALLWLIKSSGGECPETSRLAFLTCPHGLCSPSGHAPEPRLLPRSSHAPETVDQWGKRRDPWLETVFVALVHVVVKRTMLLSSISSPLSSFRCRIFSTDSCQHEVTKD